MWAKLISRKREIGERGVGDTFHRLAGRVGTAYERLWIRLGSSCNCQDRRARWNRMFRYESKTEST